jgi:predicted amidophosphoribosyltransferase
VPVPMYFWKKIFRWYNQSELLVKYISKQTGITPEYKLLKKIKKTPQQSHLTKKQRQNNLGGSVVVNKILLDKNRHKTIILIDDVISTGATLKTISQLLRNNWAHHVIWCVFASD